ncbi:Uncharacterized protein APZ42_001826 [Daphnia magna]|uniref:Uncharacterized protein n=1 Tax=Daphnia magna TaxID=35525 RepID=A0A164IQ35_9CRUS|nr:Uncharacterized protein APZ42_001826 [Daphnia magna]
MAVESTMLRLVLTPQTRNTSKCESKWINFLTWLCNGNREKSFSSC